MQGFYKKQQLEGKWFWHSICHSKTKDHCAILLKTAQILPVI